MRADSVSMTGSRCFRPTIPSSAYRDKHLARAAASLKLSVQTTVESPSNAPPNEQHRTQRARWHGPDRHAVAVARPVGQCGPRVHEAGLPDEGESVECALPESRYARRRAPRVHAGVDERGSALLDARAARPSEGTASVCRGSGLVRPHGADRGIGPTAQGHRCSGADDSKSTPQRVAHGSALQLPALACPSSDSVLRPSAATTHHGRATGREVRPHGDVSVSRGIKK